MRSVCMCVMIQSTNGGEGLFADAHLLWNFAALWAEASNRGAFLTLSLGIFIRVKLGKVFRLLFLQFVGQVMKDACTVLHRLYVSRR